MQYTENYTIDLSNCKDTEELVNNVVTALDIPFDKNLPVKLKLDDVEISEAQLASIKSLITGYGSRLGIVETERESTGDMCRKMGILTSNFENLSSAKAAVDEIKNAELEDLREEFKSGLEETPAENESDAADNGAVKQVISVYRKAYKEENEAEFSDNEDVDFYAAPTDEPVIIDSKKTICINQTLRSGQILEYDGNIVIIGDCHPGSEIRAAGDITVWGVLGSVAHAGCKGNKEAKIRALKMNAIQLRIADYYSRRPDTGNIPYVVKSSVFTPEEARLVDDNIVLFKMAQN